MRRVVSKLLPVLALSIPLACGGSGSGVLTPEQDSDKPDEGVSFDFSGAWTGSFQATGDLIADGDGPAELDMARLDYQLSGASLVAVDWTDGVANGIRFEISRREVGEYRLAWRCPHEEHCIKAWMRFGFDSWDTQSDGDLFDFVDGMLRITMSTDDRLAGEFTATGRRRDDEESPELYITGGQFSVPLFESP